MTHHEIAHLYGRHWGAKEAEMTAAQLHRSVACHEIAERLRARAELYAPSNGRYGPLSIVWGWGSIGKELRAIADEIEHILDTPPQRGSLPNSETAASLELGPPLTPGLCKGEDTDG